jgi:signal peptidase I
MRGTRGPDSQPVRFRAGWGWLIAFTLSQSFLTFAGALAAISLLPALAVGWSGFVVQSGSMEPVIGVGDLALVSPLGPDDAISLGTVIAFHSPAEAEPSGLPQVRLHRVAEIDDNGDYVTAGDANRDLDSTAVTREQIIGPGRILVRFIGLPSYWVSHGELAPLIGSACVAGLALTIVSLGFPRRHLAARQHRTRRPVLPAMRTVGAALAVIGLAMGVSVLPQGPASAGYTAQTRSSASWSTGVSSTLSAGRLTSYGLFAGTAILDAAGVTSVLGSIGTSPGSTISGFSAGDVTGATDRNTGSAQNARSDALALSAAIAGRPSTPHATSLIGTFAPGTYSNNVAFQINGGITLNAGGDSSAIFVFTAPSLTSASSSTITLANGASANNVYWHITGSVNLAANSTIRGTVIAGDSIVAGNKVSVTGRLVALNGTISTSRATVTLP